MKIIGLTGGIASGKSTVTETLKELGAYIINTDLVAHECMEPGGPVWKAIVDSFGEEILQEDRRIDRGKLGAIVFSDPVRLQLLDTLTHPAVLAETARRVEAFRAQHPDGVVVEEIPLLYEVHLEESQVFDEIWVVWVDRARQLERLMQRDQIDRETAEKKLASQLPLDEKANRADRVINNMGTREEAVHQTRRFFYDLTEEHPGGISK